MSYSNVEAVFRLLAQLPSRYAKSLESLCEQAARCLTAGFTS